MKGVIFAGSMGRQSAISRESVESVAAELALALGLEEEETAARLRSDDLNIVRSVFSRHAAEPSLDALLSYLAASCTRPTETEEAPGAAFAVIGALRDQPETPWKSFSVEFLWHSGDASWTHAIESAPLSNVWRRALDARQVIGIESQMGGSQGSVARIVAFPLESEGQLLGTLVVGMPVDAISLATLDRLALRATLAATALRERKQNAQDAKSAARQRALLNCITEPLLLLDDAEKITAMSRGASELTGVAAKTGASQAAGLLPQTNNGKRASTPCTEEKTEIGKVKLENPANGTRMNLRLQFFN